MRFVIICFACVNVSEHEMMKLRCFVIAAHKGSASDANVDLADPRNAIISVKPAPDF